ncbi:MAG: ZIP family metal transporter, partial [Crocinitomicaceae bacterium]|nr:ZIP family metal transporter [Crocinitomicaceae bacterium]
MKEIIKYFADLDPVLAAFYATCFTWLLTAVGASTVFFFKTLRRSILDGLLGFTGGVM